LPVPSDWVPFFSQMAVLWIPVRSGSDAANDYGTLKGAGARGGGRLLSSGVPQTYAAGRLVPDVAKKNSTAFIVRGKAAQEDYLPLRSFGTP